jgi:hypothetical protein
MRINIVISFETLIDVEMLNKLDHFVISMYILV